MLEHDVCNCKTSDEFSRYFGKIMQSRKWRSGEVHLSHNGLAEYSFHVEGLEWQQRVRKEILEFVKSVSRKHSRHVDRGYESLQEGIVSNRLKNI